MWYLFLQVWILFLISYILGVLTHWFFCCHNNGPVTSINTETRVVSPDATAPVAAKTPQKEAVSDDWKPLGFSSRPDKVDDIKRIKGIGKVIEKTLNDLGIYQFEQIANWDSDNVKWVDDFLLFSGRIDREVWVEQARTLSEGGTTEFAKRVDKGEMNY